MKYLLLLVAVALALSAFGEPSRVSADHDQYLYQAANRHEDEMDERFTFVPYYWLDKQPLGWCPSAAMDVPATRDAVATWQTSTSWAFDEWARRCGAGQQVSIMDRWSQGYIPDWCINEQLVGCTESTFGWDSARTGFYISSSRVYVDNVTYGFPNYDGLRAVVTHELGHVYGLADVYPHTAPPSCGSLTSIMDAIRLVPGNGKMNVSTGCDGTYLQSYDTYHTNLMYRMDSPYFQPTELRLGTPAPPGKMLLRFKDASPSEWGYVIKVFRWSGNDWIVLPNTYYGYGNAPGDNYGLWTGSFDWTRPASSPPGTFQACMWTQTVIGLAYWKCFPYTGVN